MLSLILAGNDPGAEYALEEARAGGYLNRALAHTIYTGFGREFAASPRLGEMTVLMMEAFAGLGMNREVVLVGTDFLKGHPAAGEYERVALGVADAHVRLKEGPD